MLSTYEVLSKGLKMAVKLCRIISAELKKHPRLINGLFNFYNKPIWLINFENEPIWLIYF
jgi:hypothetical protein